MRDRQVSSSVTRRAYTFLYTLWIVVIAINAIMLYLLISITLPWWTYAGWSGVNLLSLNFWWSDFWLTVLPIHLIVPIVISVPAWIMSRRSLSRRMRSECESVGDLPVGKLPHRAYIIPFVCVSVHILVTIVLPSIAYILGILVVWRAFQQYVV